MTSLPVVGHSRPQSTGLSENEIHMESQGPFKRPLSRTRTVVHVNQAEAALAKVDEFDDKSIDMSDGSSPSSSTDIPGLDQERPQPRNSDVVSLIELLIFRDLGF
jgi:hypothetical protein